VSNPSKQKGTDGENAVMRALQESGWPHVERRALSGVNDKGDISGIPGVVIEVKNEKKMTLASYLAETKVEMANANADHGVAWIKRPGKGNALDWYVLMDGHEYVKCLRKMGY
jgi:Holliday junction resolvase